ncbi:MAG: AMP-binding protein [Bacteroidales bacterium]|nr:AMP-binding protein [Bacteroidales bacterium]
MIKENYVEYYENAIRDNWDCLSMQDYDDKNSAITFGTLGNTILKLHKLFSDCGIKDGDKIVVVGKNSVNWGCVYLAATTYGAVIVPLLQDFTPKDIYALTNHSDARLAFVSNYILQKMDVSNFEIVEEIFKLDDFESYFKRSGDAHAIDKNLPEVNAANFKLPAISNDRLGVILYTSGTSGQPKGVMLQLNSLAANIRFAREHIKLQPKDRIVSFLPLAHCYGCAFDFLYPLTLGCHTIFLGKLPSPQVILKAFGEYKPRLILSVPLVLEKIYKGKLKPTLDKPIVKFLTKIPGIRELLYKKINNTLSEAFGGNFLELVLGGAKMSREVEIFLQKIKFRFTVGYGMTECGPLVSYCDWSTTKPFSTGQLVDCLEAKVDADKPGKIGEIYVRGENVMIGYYKNPEETARAIDEEGWLHTGDLGVIDENNFITLKGRCKTMILTSSGQNVYPEEIESKLSNYSIIGECVVTSRNAKIIAIIYPNPDDVKGLSPEEIETKLNDVKKEINSQVPAYMQINSIQIRNEEFEKTPKKSIKRYLYA